MTPSKLLKKFLHTGSRPADQRSQSALLDESRSIIASQLQTTLEHMQNFTDLDIDNILAGGKGSTLERMNAIHREKYADAAPRTPTAAPAQRPATARPAKKDDRVKELAAFVMNNRKPLAKAHVSKSSPAPVNRFKTSTEAVVMQAAMHRSSPAADRAEARAELEARGLKFSANGKTIFKSANL